MTATWMRASQLRQGDVIVIDGQQHTVTSCEPRSDDRVEIFFVNRPAVTRQAGVRTCVTTEVEERTEPGFHTVRVRAKNIRRGDQALLNDNSGRFASVTGVSNIPNQPDKIRIYFGMDYPPIDVLPDYLIVIKLREGVEPESPDEQKPLSEPHTPDTPDDILSKWVAECESIYECRTAGDYTWEGVLSSFGRELLTAFKNGNYDVIKINPTTTDKEA
jgi:hypothetical protein